MNLITFLGYVGLVTSFIYLYLEFRQRTSMWLWSILCSAVYIVIFFSKQLYADVAFSAFNICISVWGLLQWRKRAMVRREGEEVIEYRVLDLRGWLMVAGVFVVVFGGLYAFLRLGTDSPVPGYDAFNTALNIVGTWILGRKVIEVWGVWFLANVASVWLYAMRSNVDGQLYARLSGDLPHWLASVLAQDMLSSVLLYVVYTLASVYGFCKWLRCGVRID